jgi:hypothetical protein
MRDAMAAKQPLMQRGGGAVERLLDTALHLCQQCASASAAQRRRPRAHARARRARRAAHARAARAGAR